MTAIWRHGDAGWGIAAPAAFSDEAALHDLIAEAPEILPLAGAPTLAVLGREVYLGGNSADLIAVEATGRLVIIEVKLAKNSEARRAVVAQVLSYAAFLRGTSVETLEGSILSGSLGKRGLESIADAARHQDQTGSFDAEAFRAALRESLRTGAFRLVVVLDSAPAELVRLFGYLESIAEHLILDLVTVAKYIVGSEEVLVPQRIEPSGEDEHAKPTAAAKTSGQTTSGSTDFRAFVANATGATREKLSLLIDWAESLARDELCTLTTYRSPRGDASLLPRMSDEGVGFVTIWSTGALTPWRSVFERRAPASLTLLDELTAKPISQGANVAVTPQILELITRAYREAASRLPEG